MPIYAVHCPALDRDPQAAFDRAKTLKLGFARWAFVFGPLWLLVNGLWFALAGWVLVAALVGLGLAFGALPPEAGAALYALAALFLGLQGRALQSAEFARRGSPLADVVTAPAAVDAERGFLARALAEQSVAPAGTRGFAPSARGEPQILGLFPEAGAR